MNKHRLIQETHAAATTPRALDMDRRRAHASHSNCPGPSKVSHFLSTMVKCPNSSRSIDAVNVAVPVPSGWDVAQHVANGTRSSKNLM